MSKNALPDPHQMATSDEEIAAIFGVQDGEALVLKEGEVLVVLTASGQVIWISKGKELDPEMVAQLIAYLMNVNAIKGLINKYKIKSSISDKIRPKTGSLTDIASVEAPTSTPGFKGNGRNR